MINFKQLISNNLILKITSLNAVVISVRLIVSLIIQRLLAITVGEVGIAKIGQLRNLMQIITSSSSLGIFNGVLKYVAEFKDDNQQLNKLFSTAFIFVLIGTILSSIILFFCSSWITIYLFGDIEFIYLIKILALLPPVIAVNRIFQAIINGLTEYKKYAKIEFLSYMVSAALLLGCLYYYNLIGVLFSIILTPIIQLLVIAYIFGSKLKAFISIKGLSYNLPFIKPLLAYTLMSIISTVLLNYIELDVRTMITNKISINEAGYWTAMNFISKNYMVFSSGLFTLYVIPKFATIYNGRIFFKEVLNIYKTLLPLFGLGMLMVFIFRNVFIDIIYPNFTGMEPLFKWQLLGDFVRLATLVVSHQFLAKKMVKSFVITELLSLALFFFLAKYLVVSYGAEGVVMAHFYRYIIYFTVVIFAVWNYFRTQKTEDNEA